MQVNVKLFATFRKFAPPETPLGESFKVNLKIGTIMELLNKLGIPSDQARIIILNGNRVSDLNQKLQPNDLIVLFPPVGGG